MEMRLLSAALENEIEAAQSETLELIKTLCRIPAPSHREERRAAFIREWLEARGFSAEIDDAKNVRCGWGVEESGEIAVVMAHIDTVFPDLEPMPMRVKNIFICSGVVFCASSKMIKAWFKVRPRMYAKGAISMAFFSKRRATLSKPIKS